MVINSIFFIAVNMVNLYVRGTVLHQIDTATAATVADVLSLVAVNEEIAVQDVSRVEKYHLRYITIENLSYDKLFFSMLKLQTNCL